MAWQAFPGIDVGVVFYCLIDVDVAILATGTQITRNLATQTSISRNAATPTQNPRKAGHANVNLEERRHANAKPRERDTWELTMAAVRECQKQGLHLQVLGLTQKANAGFKRTMLVAIRDTFEEGPENWVAAEWLLQRKRLQEYALRAGSIGRRARTASRNNVKIGSRIRAISDLSAARIRSMEDELIGATGKEEERIRRAIAKEQSKTAEKIAILDEKMSQVGTYALDAVCLLDVI